MLDNLESLLEVRDAQGRFRVGYEDYGVLLKRVAQSAHQSCLLLTSREMPAHLALLERQREGVRALRLSGLEPAACEQLLADRQVSGSAQDYVRLAQQYDGNPLVLNIVAESISELFGGQISFFLEQDTMIFSSIRDLLAEQWNRLSATEQTLLFWLAVGREAVSGEHLHAQLVPAVDWMQVAEALQALGRRSLVELVKVKTGDREAARYSLHSAVLEYVMELLVERVSEQIEQAQWEDLVSYALEQASAKDYVRQVQERLIVGPILLRLQAIYLETEAVEQQLVRGLRELRTWEQQAQGYGPANLLMLLRGLRGLDLSGLAIRGAYLQGVEMQDTTLAGASLRDTLLTEAFDGITAVAISPSSQYWAMGSKRGEVRVWRLEGHEGAIRCVAWSSDGARLASGGGRRDSGELLVWEASSGALLRTDLSHPAVVTALSWAASGQVVVTGSSDGRLRWWNLPSAGGLECVRVQEAHQGTVQALKVSPHGGRLASCGDDGAIHIWQLESGEHVRTLRRDRPYERLNITGIRGLTQAELATLRALGAVEDEADEQSTSPEQAAQL